MLSIVATLVALGLSGAPILPQPSVAANTALQTTTGSAGFKAAAAALDRDCGRHIAETIRLTEIPSPPFKEAERAQVYLELLKQHGLSDVAGAVTEENAKRSIAKGKITVDVKLTGDRPSGQTPASSRIVEIASASVRAFGLTPSLTFSSNDSNIPISLGIPAITLDAGGASDRNHALDEWIDLEKTSSLRGMQIMLATLVTLAGMP